MAQLAKITDLTVKDVRFPTSKETDISDSIHEPDFSCAYVTLHTDSGFTGYGFTFTIGRGNDIGEKLIEAHVQCLVCNAVKAYVSHIVGKPLDYLFNNLAEFFRSLTQDSQLRWLGPEKGVTHLAIAAIMNAVWDLYAKVEGKPLWKLLADMTPEQLLSAIDLSYLADAITKEEALEMLKAGQIGKEKRIEELQVNGYPAYNTSVGWLDCSDESVPNLCKEAMGDGFTKFKVKVGVDLDQDIRRLTLFRQIVGDQATLMVDANQRWDVPTSISWMKALKQFNLLWIEEPTSPDDILGHKAISEALKSSGIGVATGEHCQNRVMFKQFLMSGAMQFCQIDSCRLASPTEIIPVYLMAAKYNVPVCPHAGGVGLCEYVQHLSIFDYIGISKSMDKRVIEFVDHLHEHFEDPVVIKDGCYMLPKIAGYSAEMNPRTIEQFTYPNGPEWMSLFAKGVYKKPECC